MTKSDIKVLNDFMDRLADVMSAAGCNDIALTDTPEHRELVAAAYSGDDFEPEAKNGEIYCQDFMILNELRGRLNTQLFAEKILRGKNEYIKTLEDTCRMAYLALSSVMRHAPNYDWNADPLSLTLLAGSAFERLETIPTIVKGA